MAELTYSPTLEAADIRIYCDNDARYELYSHSPNNHLPPWFDEANWLFLSNPPLTPCKMNPPLLSSFNKLITMGYALWDLSGHDANRPLRCTITVCDIQLQHKPAAFPTPLLYIWPAILSAGILYKPTAPMHIDLLSVTSMTLIHEVTNAFLFLQLSLTSTS